MKHRLANPFSVFSVIEFPQTQSHEVFKTKSGGSLSINFALPIDLVQMFFLYDQEELKKVPQDIRGLRNYRVENLPNGSIGGTEFHRIRQEIITGVAGRVRWVCEDIYGDKREFVLTPENGVWMPPFIMHTYFVEENGSGLAVVCNTLFPLPANPTTNDTFSLEEFHELSHSVKGSSSDF